MADDDIVGGGGYDPRGPQGSYSTGSDKVPGSANYNPFSQARSGGGTAYKPGPGPAGGLGAVGHAIGQGLTNAANGIINGAKNLKRNLQGSPVHVAPATGPEQQGRSGPQQRAGNIAQGRSAAASGFPVHSPVSHPGQKPNVPMKAAVGNRGHSTTHPPTPATSHSSPARHTRPQHAVSKATAGTQHTHSSGSKAGHPTHGSGGTHPKGGSKGKSKGKSKSKSKKK